MLTKGVQVIHAASQMLLILNVVNNFFQFVVLDRLLWHNKWQETHSDSIHQHHSKWPWDEMHHLSCTIPTAQANQRE